MKTHNFKYNPINNFPKSGLVSAESPSNIALVKYWGKKPTQIPTNPSLSFTLKNCHTVTSIEFKKSNNFSFNFTIDGKKNTSFLPKIEAFFSRIKEFAPFLFQYSIAISTKNTFPHSSGIASSASGFSALALAIVQLEQKISVISLLSNSIAFNNPAPLIFLILLELNLDNSFLKNNPNLYEFSHNFSS